MIKLLTLTIFGVMYGPIAVADTPAYDGLPTKRNLPINPTSFCEGVENIKAKMVQEIDFELGQLCVNGQPHAQFTDLYSRTIDSTGQIVGGKSFTYKNGQTVANNQANSAGVPTVGGGKVGMFYTYAMKIDKKAVPLLLAEEPYIQNAADYESKDYNDAPEDFNMLFSLVTPLPNQGDCDTAFRVFQNSKRTEDPASFNDNSYHDLKLYRLHDRNFDFLLAARTLDTEAYRESDPQFQHSVALRAVMTDPNDSSKAMSFTVINLVMDNRDREDNLVSAVQHFLETDAQNVNTYHKQN